jgi:hypothetical protein
MAMSCPVTGAETEDTLHRVTTVGGMVVFGEPPANHGSIYWGCSPWKALLDFLILSRWM